MAFDTSELVKLRRIVAIAQKLIAGAPKRKRGRPTLKVGAKKHRNGKRVRRTGQELIRFRTMLRAERNNGSSVADLARKHGVSSAYIYML